MAKKKVLFECQHCGMTSPKWMGKCTNCGAWDSLVELNEQQQEIVKLTSSSPTGKSKAQAIVEVTNTEITRYSSNDIELDLVLGGGVVPGSLTLIGGSPGVGKSTLLLKIGANIANMVVGRNPAGKAAMMGLNLDAPLDEAGVEGILALKGVAAARFIALGR